MYSLSLQTHKQMINKTVPLLSGLSEDVAGGPARIQPFFNEGVTHLVRSDVFVLDRKKHTEHLVSILPMMA